MTDEERRRRSIEGIARDRRRVWGEISDQEYVVAWSRRLVELLPVTEPQDEWQAQLQSARRAAAANLEAVDMGKPLPEADPKDERNINELLNAVPDIERHVMMVAAGMGDFPDADSPLPKPSPPTSGLQETAVELDILSGGRSSGLLFLAILGLPLGCAFVVAFAVLALGLGAALTLIGVGDSGAPGVITVVVALAGAAAVVVVVYRKLIPRVPWLRRLINR